MTTRHTVQRTTTLRRLSALLLVIILGPLFAIAPAVARAQSTPVPLPDAFGLGVLAARDEKVLDDWMPDTGVPWTYAYEYLAGGVNTGEGWQDTHRTFPLTFSAKAATQGYTPVLVFDQLVPNLGPCEDCEEMERYLTVLNDKKVMAAYYANFVKALRYLSQGGVDGLGFGGTVIVDVQPQLSGFAQQAVADKKACFGFCTGEGDDPALLRAAVGSTGNKDLDGFEDTYRGFNAAMLHLRDRYASNVRLAFHVAAWGVEDDISRSDNPKLDAEIIGRATGDFAARSGATQIRPDVSAYDVLFNDLDWADAGYLKYQQKWDPTFWDRRNVQFPNFRRWFRWVRTITSRTGLQMIVMHIPVGNQQYVAVDNTEGHYQDNRAEYFLSHISEVRAAGIAGLLFGSPTTGATSAWDGRRDGVHQPSKPVCTTDGDSTGVRICPHIKTKLTDDDGGFLRTQAARYYRAALPAASSGLPAGVIAAALALFVAAAGGIGFFRRRRSRISEQARVTEPKAATPSGPISVGDTFASGRFEIVRPLGAGGMKRVYLARDTLLDRVVAIGVLRADELDDTDLTRARREVKALARLGDHPHVVTVYDTGDEAGRPYFVCQYVSGGSLHELIGSRGVVGIEEAVRLAGDVCEALVHAHAGGIMHRDVKPANVWLDDRGRALLGDFGLATAVDQTKVTATGAILGTVAYMAPEQALGNPRPASDLYALGAMLHELLTGAPPFEGSTMAVLHSHVNAAPQPPSRRNPAVPPALDMLVGELLSKQPGSRPDALTTLARLRAIQATADTAPTPSPEPLETVEGQPPDLSEA